MKRIISLAVICLSLVQLLAQNLPQGIAYQAVAVKDGPYSLAGQNPQAIYWSDKQIQVRFTIYEKYPGGSTQYSEFHVTKTDDYGVFNLIIGQGNVISGDFTKIPWDLGTAHLQVEIDFENNGTYKLTSLERFWSVPYAFVTRKSSSNSTDSALNALNGKFNYLKNRDKDTVIGNEGGVSYKSLDSLNKVLVAKLSALKASDKDTVIGNEWQKLTRNKDTLSLSDGGGKVTLLDEDPKNELQLLTRTKDTVSLSQNGGKFILNDDDPKNELQDLLLRNDTLFLSKSAAGIPIANLSKTGASSTTSKNPSINKDVDIEYFCLDSKASNLGIAQPSVEYLCENGDSIFYFGSYNISSSSRGSFIVAKSKLNCGLKLTFKSTSSDFGHLQWGNVKNKVYFSYYDQLILFDLSNYKLINVNVNFPSNGTNQTNFFGFGINMGSPRAWTTYKDTGYVIFRRIRNISSGSYWESHRLYKFILNTGQITKIDSISNFEMFGFSQYQNPVQYMDSVIFFWHNDSLKQLDIRTLNMKTIWKNPYNKYLLPPEGAKYFHVYTNDLLISEIRSNSATGATINICLVTDLKTNKSILDDNFYGYLQNYEFYWLLRKRSLGTNRMYIVLPSSIEDPWNRPYGYMSPPILYYPK